MDITIFPMLFVQRKIRKEPNSSDIPSLAEADLV